MPRDGSGVYTLPAGNPVVTNTLIASTWANGTMSDIAAQLNNVFTRDGLLGPTGPFKIVDGTVAAPGLAFNSEPGLGMYRLGANQIAWAAAGSQVLRWTANNAVATNFSLFPRTGGSSRIFLNSQPEGNPNVSQLVIGSGDGAHSLNETFAGTAVAKPLLLTFPAAVYVSNNFFALNGTGAVAGFSWDGSNGNYLHMLSLDPVWRWQADRTLGRLTWQRNGFSPNTVFHENGDFFSGRDLWAGTDTAFGLVGSSAGFRSLRFAGDNWRIQFSTATGNLDYVNSVNTGLFGIAANGSIYATGSINAKYQLLIGNPGGAGAYSTIILQTASGRKDIRSSPQNTLEVVNSANTLAIAVIDDSGGLNMNKGYFGRNGMGGALSPTVQNLYWTGTGFRVWADSTDLGIMNTTSDERVKKDIYPLEAARDAYMGIVPIRYHMADVGIWKDDGAEKWGFSAQQLIATGFEKAVGGDVTAVQEDGTPQPASVDDRPILAQTVLMVQDLINRVTQLENA